MNDTRFYYVVYGLRVVSDRPIMSLREVEPCTPDLHLQFLDVEKLGDSPGGLCLYRSSGLNPLGAPYLEVFVPDESNQGHWSIRHRSEVGAIDFELFKSPKTIRINVQAGTPPVDIEAYLTGVVLGFFLRLCGYTCLHGGFVSYKGMAIGVVGPKGAGKSSLVGSWARQGVAVLADDIGVLRASEQSWAIEPAYPRIRLWPPTFDGLGFEEQHNDGRVMSFADKAYVSLREPPFCFQEKATDLAAIISLTPRSDAQMHMERVSGAAALATLLPQVYAATAGGHSARKRDISRLTDVLSHCAVYRVALPDSFDWLANNSLELLDAVSERSI